MKTYQLTKMEGKDSGNINYIILKTLNEWFSRREIKI